MNNIDRFILLIDSADRELLINTDHLRYARFVEDKNGDDNLTLYLGEDGSVLVQQGKESDRIWKRLKEALPQWARVMSRSTDQN